MNIMECRYDALREALAGYEKTGMPFLGYDGVSVKYPGFGDDQGIYYLIPKIANLFQITLDQAINVFFGGMILFSLLLGFTGSFLLFKRKASRFIAVLGLGFLSFIAYKISDVYIAASSSAVATIPLFVFFIKRQTATKPFFAFLFLAGLGLGTLQFVRAHSATAVILFMVFILLTKRLIGKMRLTLFLSLTLGVLISTSFFHILLNSRDSYLLQHESRPAAEKHHIFWHSVYIGLGFIDNPFVDGYRDQVAIEKAKSINPNIQLSSKEYERVLKKEVIAFIIKHPTFFVLNVGAKFGVMALYLIMFANVGLVLAFFYKKQWQVESAFWIAMIFSSLFGILVVPYPNYVLGFMAFATLYGIISIDSALESDIPILQRFLKSLKTSCVE